MVHVHRKPAGFTLVELLVVVAIIGALAGFLVPNIIRAKTKAKQIECLNKVKGIGAMLLAYADDTGNNGFPFGNGQKPLAYESLQKLVDAYPGELKPEQFICPESIDERAVADAKSKFVLTEQNCSYAYLAQKKRSAKGTTILISDDSIKDEEAGVEENHEGGVNVFFADNSARFFKKEEFQDAELPPGLVGNHQ